MDTRTDYKGASRLKSSDSEIARQVAIEKRRERAKLEYFNIEPELPGQVLGYFNVVGNSGFPYTVEIRDPDRLVNRCSCPDYTGNNLGTCKHIEAVLIYIRRKHRGKLKKTREELVDKRRLHVQLGLAYDQGWHIDAQHDESLDLGILRLIQFYITPYRDEINSDPSRFAFRLSTFQEQVEDYGGTVGVDPEIWDYVAHVGHRLEQAHERADLLRRIEAGEESLDLVKVPLFPFQLVGVLFLAFTERAMLADDLGLGKTAQAIAAAKLLMRARGITRVLVITPASVKLQWAREVARFAGDSVTVIGGTKARRAKQYAEAGTFVVINYELVLRDYEQIQALEPALIVLDEAQRIKNWQAKTTRRIKELESPYAFVLTGTPLENRLEELYSVVQFLDARLLGPAWQFLAEHTTQDAFGAIIGYKNLAEVRRTLAPILLRRRKAEVLEELPERTDQYYWVELKPDQAKLYKPMERQLLELLSTRREWTFEDRSQVLRLLTHLRELADAAQLVAPEVAASSKLEELASIVTDIVAEGHKVLIFSQWERMTRLVQATLEKIGIPSLRLYGGLDQKSRDNITRQFQEDPNVPVFISTDAGGLGLNLQAASYVINVDLPWNPAKLEQRIGRAHRMGQTQKVTVINIVATGTIEQRVLDILYKKQELFNELFDSDADTLEFAESRRIDQFRDLVEQLVKGDK